MGFGATDADVELVLGEVRRAWAPRRQVVPLVRRALRQRVRATRRRLSGGVTPLVLRAPRGRQVLVLSPSGPAGLDFQRFHARHVQADSLDDVACQLKRFGPFDAIVDVSRAGEFPHDTTWATSFLHLREGGVYVSVHRGANPLSARLPLAEEGGSEQWAERVVGSVISHGPMLAVEKRGRHYVKLRDEEVEHLLPTRQEPVRSTVLATLPPGDLHSRTTLVSHGAGTTPKGFDPVLSYPELRMRLYTGDIAMATHSLLFTEGTLLPETFRHHLHRRLQHIKVTNTGQEFGTLAAKHSPGVRLEGTFYHLNSPFPGHFGHVMTEVVSRLWGWDQAKREFPALKAIWHTGSSPEHDRELERQVFRAYGIDEQDLVCVDRPVLLNRVVAVTPMWHNNPPHYVHPDMAGTWKRIGSGLATDAVSEVPKVFVSRRPTLARACRNATEVEDVFREHGFTVVYPEELTLAQQADTFRNARVVAGFGGSAMFNIMYCERLTHLIVLAHEAYTARNEYLFASLLGGQTHYFWSAPEVAHPAGGWTQEAFTSSWSFDFSGLGGELELLLGSLPGSD